MLVLVSVSIVAATFSDLSANTEGQLVSAYDEFLRSFGHRSEGDADHVGYAARSSLFQLRQAEVDAHNSRGGRLWTAAINKFADYTDAEKKSMLGYRRIGGRWDEQPSEYSARSPLATSFLGLAEEDHSTRKRTQSKTLSVVKETMDWRTNLTSSGFIRSQGGCGSCWAVATVGALEMHAELTQRKAAAQQGRGEFRNLRAHSFAEGNMAGFEVTSVSEMSDDELVACTPNPEHCGGTGGCEGATAELALKYVQENGLYGDAAFLELGERNNCKRAGSGSSFASIGERVGSILKISGYNRLATNNYDQLLRTVSDVGPAIVSTDSTKWFSYSTGIFDDCSPDAIVNHAVLAVGYGTDASSDYWLIRNSWGRTWGEDGQGNRGGGYLRLLRHSGPDKYCGIDNDAQKGVACDKDPKVVPVCGMCGVLSDSCYPEDVQLLRAV